MKGIPIIYSKRTGLFPADRDYLFPTLAEHLQKSTTSLETWLNTFRPLIRSIIARAKRPATHGTLSIRDYFTCQRQGAEYRARGSVVHRRRAQRDSHNNMNPFHLVPHDKIPRPIFQAPAIVFDDGCIRRYHVPILFDQCINQSVDDLKPINRRKKRKKQPPN